jgi:hypothetical protein
LLFVCYLGTINLQVGAYVIARGIQDEPAFAWWVPYVMRKRDIIVLMVKSRVRRTTHKHGIEMPAPGRDTVQNAIDLDHKNSDTFWMDSLAKEMRNLNIACKYLELGEKAPPGCLKLQDKSSLMQKWTSRGKLGGSRTVIRPQTPPLQALPVLYLVRVLELG